MDGGKENRHGRLHAKEFRNKQKHKEANNPTPPKRPPIVAQQPLPDPGGLLEDLDSVISGDNFNDLADKSGSSGGRFVLKTERDWNKDIVLGSGSDQFSHYFDLDVQQLAQSIATIPFHERFNLEDVAVTDIIKDQFVQEAQQKRKMAKGGEQITVVERVSVNAQQVQPVVDTNKEAINTIPQMPVEIISPVSPVQLESTDRISPKEDIQDWLDNVLDL